MVARAIDRPLSKKEMAELRSHSTRVRRRASDHLSTSPSLGRVPVAVEQAINEGAERRLRVTTI